MCVSTKKIANGIFYSVAMDFLKINSTSSGENSMTHYSVVSALIKFSPLLTTSPIIRVGRQALGETVLLDCLLTSLRQVKTSSTSQ